MRGAPAIITCVPHVCSHVHACCLCHIALYPSLKRLNGNLQLQTCAMADANSVGFFIRCLPEECAPEELGE